MIVSVPPNFANAISPFSPLGRQPVSEENPESKGTRFKSVEESAELARSENRRGPEDRPNEVEERERLRGVNEEDAQEGRQSEEDTRDDQSGVTEEQRLDDEQRQIRELSSRDREVRAHERAHSSVGGEFAGSPRLQFTRGPDGGSYAVAGEVSISTAPVEGDPEATIEKARQIRAAANAPADPSPQDRRVAAQAAQMELSARADLSELQRQEAQQGRDELAVQDEQARLKEEAREQERIESLEESELQADQPDASVEFNNAASRVSADLIQQNIELRRRLESLSDIGPTTAPGVLFDQSV